MKQKINANISLSLNSNDEVIRLRIKDEASRVVFIELELNDKQFRQMISNLMNVEVDACTVTDLEKVGKEKITEPFIFEMDGKVSNRDFMAIHATSVCPKGWTPSLYFGSKDSYYYIEGAGCRYTTIIKTTMSKWVDKEEEDENDR